MKKILTKELDIYSIIALAILIMYVVWLTFFLVNADKEIKNIYRWIDARRAETQLLIEQIEKIRLDNKNNIYFLDFESDNSIHKFVSPNVSFSDKWYIPEGLEKIWSDVVYDAKGGWQLLTNETNEALQKIWKAFYLRFKKKLSIVSAYRSYLYQAGIKSRWCPDNLCAKAWFSEHQSGLAVDIWDASSNSVWKNNKDLKSYYDWFNENAHIYGFTNSYQKWPEIDWYEIEPWHWRYIWEEMATYLKEHKLTFSEFYNSISD